jgi:hypothetical protein
MVYLEVKMDKNPEGSEYSKSREARWKGESRNGAVPVAGLFVRDEQRKAGNL